MNRRVAALVRMGIGVAVGFLALMLLGLLGFERWVARKERELVEYSARFDAQLEREWPSFLQDLELLAVEPITAAGEREHDASTVLSQVVRTHATEASVRFPDALLAKASRKDWLVHPEDVSGLNLGWMATLAPFDHWALLPTPRVRSEEAILNAVMESMDSQVLKAWPRARWLQALRRGDFAEAQAETRLFTRLILSTGSHRAAGTAFPILKLEQAVHAHLVERGQMPRWIPLSQDFLERYRRVWLRYPVYLSFFSPERMWRELMAPSRRTILMCGVFSSTMITQAFAMRVLRDEQSLVRYRMAAQALEPMCGSSRFLPLVATPAEAPNRGPFPINGFVRRYQEAAIRLTLKRNLGNGLSWKE